MSEAPAIIIPKINVIMDSQILTALMNCPRYADFRFNHDLVAKKGKSNSLECGTLVHLILENYRRSLMNGKSRSESLDVAFESGNEYIRLGDDGNGLQDTPAESEGYKTGYNFVLQTMREYFAFYSNDTWTTLGVEEVRGKVIYEDDDLRVLWKAKFDWIVDTQMGVLPVDTKTMKVRRDTISMNNQFMGQCLLVGSKDICIDKVGFQKSLKESEKFLRPLIHYTTNRLQEWSQDIVPFYARMLSAYTESEYFPPNFTHCESKYGICQFKEICESDKNLREEIIKMNFISAPKWDITNDPSDGD